MTKLEEGKYPVVANVTQDNRLMVQNKMGKLETALQITKIILMIIAIGFGIYFFMTYD